MPGSTLDGLFRTPWWDGKQISRPWAKWLREIESKTRSGMNALGIIASSKLQRNIANNYSNNATVDSIDNGTNSTIRVYGPSGPGTSWHQIVGDQVGPEIPALTMTAPYTTQMYVWWDGINYQSSVSALDSLKDGVMYAGKVTTVAAGGGGGAGGGGTAHYGGGGSQR